ncbi:MAG TPA: ABC transporter ATP-binding protein [Alphaproteobacteria bacterium]|nr:ABC transporter ATP-binding protein [Alphaproteobacteria bacterium]
MRAQSLPQQESPPVSLPDYAVEAAGLNKVYRASGRGGQGKHALKDVDLRIPRGSLFGLLGPNGAGKSTFINILAGLVVKSSGHAHVWGVDIDAEPRAARAAIGVVPQELNLDAFFTPRELLDLQAGLYGIPPSERVTDELLAAVGLSAEADAYARTLSGGMRRRLMVAKAMVHNPPVLVLDEPTAGVDVALRRQLWAHVQELNRNGTTILLTTHYLEEAELLCDRIAIINHGRVIACDSKDALIRRLDRKELAVILSQELAALPAPLAAFDVELAGPRRLVFHYRPSQTRIRDILTALRDAGLGIVDLTTTEADLEDLFLEITREQPREEASDASGRQ